MSNPLGGLPHISYTCQKCFLECRTRGGLTQHDNSAHRQLTPQLDENASPTYEYHPHLTGTSTLLFYYIVLITEIAKPCDETGNYLLPHIRPHPRPTNAPEGAPTNIWDPFTSRVEFDFAYYHFVEVQNSAPLIDKALDQWAAKVMEFGREAPWKNSKELYATIDTIRHGDAPWKVYSIQYDGPRPQGTPPKWMTQTYDLCVRDARQVLHHQLETAEFKDKINLTPYRQFNSKGQRSWSNLMSADWAWTQAVRHRDSPSSYIIMTSSVE